MSASGSGLRSRPLIALLTAEAVSSLGSEMTFLALPWFVLVTTGRGGKRGRRGRATDHCASRPGS